MKAWRVPVLATLYMLLGSALAGHGVLRLLASIDPTVERGHSIDSIALGLIAWGMVGEWLTARAKSDQAREALDRIMVIPLIFVVHAAGPALAFAFGR